jgi:hypothetical protein
MAKFIVIALSVAGLHPTIFNSGDIVDTANFDEGHAEELVKQGFLKPHKEKPETAAQKKEREEAEQKAKAEEEARIKAEQEEAERKQKEEEELAAQIKAEEDAKAEASAKKSE